MAPSDQTPDYALKRRKIELEKKLAHGTKRLNQVLKTAKGFERQKLGKRIAIATKEADEDGSGKGEKIAKLDREVVAVKVRLTSAPIET